MAFVKTTISPTNTDPFFSVNTEKQDFVICKSPGKLKALLDQVIPERLVFFVSDGDWSLHDLLMELLKKYGPAELYLTTYAIREFAVRQLVMAMDRKELLGIYMIADYRAKVRTPEVYQLAQMNASKICLHSIHAKIAVLKGKDYCITILGSCNLTSNPRIEAGVITMNPDTAAFQIEWINKIMNDAEIFN